MILWKQIYLVTFVVTSSIVPSSRRRTHRACVLLEMRHLSMSIGFKGQVRSRNMLTAQFILVAKGV